MARAERSPAWNTGCNPILVTFTTTWLSPISAEQNIRSPAPSPSIRSRRRVTGNLLAVSFMDAWNHMGGSRV